MTITDYQTILKSADEHRQTLHKQLHTCRIDIDAIDVALLALDQSYATRLKAIHDARKPLAEKQAELDQSVAYAHYAHKTHRERVATKDVATSREELSTLQTHIAEMEANHLAASNEEEARREVLEKQRFDLAAECENLQAQINTVESTYTQIYSEQGQELSEERTGGYRQRASQLQEAQATWLAAQIELHDYTRASQEALANWPKQLQAFREQLPVDDSPALVLMQASLLFLDTLLANFDMLTRLEIRDLPTVQAFGKRSTFGQVKPLLMDWLTSNWEILGNPRYCKEFRDEIWHLAAEYEQLHKKK